MKTIKILLVIIFIFTVGIIYSEYQQERTHVFKGADDFTTAVNTERAQRDLEPVTDSDELKAIATQKCNDMIEREYVGHQDPNGKYIWDKAPTGYKYGENLAGNYDNSYDTMQNWVASPEHYENIIDPAFTKVGHATCYTGKDFLIVQIFRS